MISAGSPVGDVAVDAYDRVRTDFSWNIPEYYNIGPELTIKWAARDPDRVAVIECDDDRVVRTTFRKLAEQSNQLANWLTAQGCDGNELLVADLQQRVRSRLGAYQYPRIVHFLTELQMTVTGKIMRLEIRKLAGEQGADSHLPQHPG